MNTDNFTSSNLSSRPDSGDIFQSLVYPGGGFIILILALLTMLGMIAEIFLRCAQICQFTYKKNLNLMQIGNLTYVFEINSQKWVFNQTYYFQPGYSQL